MPDRVNEDWKIAVDIGSNLAKERREAEKSAVHAPQFGKERLEPAEMAKRFQEAGPELRAKMLMEMRREKDGMGQVHKLMDSINKRERPKPPRIGI